MEVDTAYGQENELVGKVAAKPKKAATKPLGPNNSHNPGGKAIEEIYQKKTQLEHILLRPDTYIGSTEKQQQTLWVHSGDKLEQRPISYVPGLYKVFDEILVNAADNKARDNSMDMLKVDIDVAKNCISVWNNGDGVPVEMHKEEAVYVPELIFGHLLTSSNYDDNEKKVTGGRNGYGAKLTNIFSTEFVVETADGKRLRKYRQVFRDNMTSKGEPLITPCKATDNWTCISFKPDLAKFGMTDLDEDTVALMAKRVHDMAGILGKGVKVYLNGKRLAIKSFPDYVELYLGPKDEAHAPRVYEHVNDRWEVVVSCTEGQFQQVSFVNSICTIKGGTHVNYLVDQITKAMVERIQKKVKKVDIKPFMIKNHLSIFINSKIENPAFDSQSKENLTLRASSFGSKCELPPAFLDKVFKIVSDVVLQYATFRADRELKKGDGTKRQRLTGIAKLDDANDAGGRHSQSCTLILTEGDSAKTLAVAGLSVVGRDQYGVFPLRGKLLNVREASAAQTSANQEIQNIKQILGLQHGKVYDDAKSLRYGHLMIMTDQDHDGSHIKGLIMNFLHTFYPTLLRVPGFLLEFITPIVKASKGKKTLTFYTMPEYESWCESLGSTRGWAIKYYKGLGTSTPKEAKEYFADLKLHRKEFVWEGEGDNEVIEMAFSKKKVEERKEWLTAFQPGTFLDNTANKITYSDFVNKELILFSRADLERSIPSMVDGLKPGQRKILFACFKRKLKTDIKVAQLGGYVSENSAYHHGEASLGSTIVGLAQDFVGSNNINLLVPSGMFGTRLQGGKDAASVRYIFTRLNPLTRHIFSEADDALLNYLNEEGQDIEPQWYMPILPMVLINGAEGIGTGWSTSIPNYNPRDIVDNIKRLMEGQEQVPMQPWYRFFRGEITEVPTKSSSKSYACTGIAEQVDDTTLKITELPIRKWTQDYKDFLEALIKPENKDETPTLVDYKDRGSDVAVEFSLTLAPGKMAEAMAEKGGIAAKFKLVTKFATSNMMLFDPEGRIKHYPSPEAVIEEFYTLRLEFYSRRRVSLLESAEAELVRLSNKVRFILAVIAGTLKVSNRKRADIERDLEEQGFDRLTATARKNKGTGAAAAAVGEEAEGGAASGGAEGEDSTGGYQYLLTMPIWSLTYEKVQELQGEAGQCEVRVTRLRATMPKQMWSDDLDAFLQAYAAWEQEAQQLREEQRRKKVKEQKKLDANKVKGKAGSKKKQGLSSEGEGSSTASADDDEFEVAPRRPAAPPKRTVAPKPAAATKAAAKPVASSSSQPTSSAAGSGVTTQLHATVSHPVAAAAAPSGKPTTSTSMPAVSQDTQLSLAARLAGKMQALQGLGRPAAPAVAALQVAAVDEGEVSSPAPTKATRPPPAKAAGGGRPAAAKSKLLGAAARGAAAPAAAKRKPRGKAVSSEDDSDIQISSSADDDSANDAFELDAPSPAVAPKGKKNKVGPSPLHMKLAAKAKAAAAKPAAAKASTSSVADDVAAGEESGEAAAARPQRVRRTAGVSYIEIGDSDEDEAPVRARRRGARIQDSDSSEFAASEEDDD